jgi:tRNA modification GTPase
MPNSPPGANATGLAATLAACLTPPGCAAIATLCIRGPRAWEIVRELFRTSDIQKLPENPDATSVWLGRIGEKDTVADQVVVTVPQIKPVPWVELHCHGGSETVRWLLEIFEKQGCRICTWPELEQATTTAPWKTAASLELVQASTVRTAAILLDQYHGAFATALTEIQAALANDDLTETSRLLESLARYVDIGRRLTTPWKVAVIGPPNVGKSSLLNALAGFQRSVVAPTPGTTRDLVTTLISVDGWPVEMIDTAGLREEGESLENQGIMLARDAAASADLSLWILDASAPPTWPEGNSLNQGKLSFVVNKTDLPPAWEIDPSHAVRVSALTGAGMADLVEALAHWLVPDPPPPGAAVPFTSNLASRIEEALNCVRAGQTDKPKQILAALANDAR